MDLLPALTNFLLTQAPALSGSRFWNYKHFFSMIALVLCDAKQKIIMLDIGSSGRRGDGDVYHRSKFADKVRRNKLNVPPPCRVDGVEGKLPFFFVGDAAFERSPYMVCPYKGNFLPPEKKVFNYRVSRGRHVVENIFAMLQRRYEILERPMRTSITVSKVVGKAICVCSSQFASHGR